MIDQLKLFVVIERLWRSRLIKKRVFVEIKGPDIICITFV